MYVAKVAGRGNLATKIETEAITIGDARTALGDLTTPCTDTTRAAEQLFPAYTTFARWYREGFKVRVLETSSSSSIPSLHHFSSSAGATVGTTGV